ncbi:MAG TPA: hypothetical protein VMG12_30280 [Polyangiaceae bacterium]|nr:hypothetical protein [Polyangiaceae bacterium]
MEDLGDTNGGLGTPAPIPEKEFLEQIDPGFAGRWVGYVENPFERDEYGQPLPAVFASGSSEVTLEYRFSGEYHEPSATLVFGSGPAPIPARGVAYPPGVDVYTALSAATPMTLQSGSIYGHFRAPVVEGFEYLLSETSYRVVGSDPGRTSLLGFAELAPFVEWCALQKPPSPPTALSECLGAIDGLTGGDPFPGGDPCTLTRPDRSVEEVDCNFMVMCGSDLCSCTEEGCAFAGSDRFSSVFLERRDDQIVGSISDALLDTGYPGWYSPMGTLRLFRAD